MPQVSFSADIKPLFSAIDISHMKRFGVELDSYAYMSNPNNANKVLATLASQDGEPPPCLLVGPIGHRASSHYSRNGRAADTSRDVFRDWKQHSSECAGRE